MTLFLVFYLVLHVLLQTKSDNQTTSLRLIWYPLQKKKCKSLDRHNNDTSHLCVHVTRAHTTISPVSNLEKEKTVVLSLSSFLGHKSYNTDMLSFSASPTDFNTADSTIWHQSKNHRRFCLGSMFGMDEGEDREQFEIMFVNCIDKSCLSVMDNHCCKFFELLIVISCSRTS